MYRLENGDCALSMTSGTCSMMAYIPSPLVITPSQYESSMTTQMSNVYTSHKPKPSTADSVANLEKENVKPNRKRAHLPENRKDFKRRKLLVGYSSVWMWLMMRSLYSKMQVMSPRQT